jgi:hypothetical protein
MRLSLDGGTFVCESDFAVSQELSDQTMLKAIKIIVKNFMACKIEVGLLLSKIPEKLIQAIFLQNFIARSILLMI